MVFSRTCAPCGGTGRQRPIAVPTCDGQQVDMRTESLAINVPAGLADGARIRVPGKGHVGRNGGETGDLYITVHVEPHPAVPSRRRRPARHDADRGARGGARRQDRGAVARRSGAAARAAGDAVRPAIPAARSRRAVGRATPAAATSLSRSGWCCRRCSTNDRRNCCASSGGSMPRMCGKN